MGHKPATCFLAAKAKRATRFGTAAGTHRVFTGTCLPVCRKGAAKEGLKETVAGAVSRGLLEREGPTQALKEDAESKKGHRRREDHMAEAEGRGGEAGSRGRTRRPGVGKASGEEGTMVHPVSRPQAGQPSSGPPCLRGGRFCGMNPGTSPKLRSLRPRPHSWSSFLPHSCSSPFRGSRLAILALRLLPSLKRTGCSQLPGNGRR